MKAAFLGGVVFLTLAGAARGADIPAKKMPVKAPPIATAYDWTGFYLGGYYGTAISHSKATSDLHTGSVDINDTGFVGGAQVGYNWQFSPSWLIGIEGDIGFLGLDRSFVDYNDPLIRVGVETEGYGTVRGRFGYVTGPSVLYATGGAAFVRLKESFGGTTGVGPTTHTTTETGWTAGGGIETKLSRNWSTKTEYLYIDLGSNSFSANVFGATETATFDNKIHVLKTGFNYKLDGPFEGFPLFNAPMLSPAYNWSGLYVGVNAGGGISEVQVPVAVNTTGVGNGNVDVNGTGFTGGVQAGYNWNVFSNWFVGIEGDINFLGIDRSFGDWFDQTRVFGIDTDWYGTVRGRIGRSTGPAFSYFTAGAAFVHLTNSLTDTITGTVARTEGTRSGWTIGGGIETPVAANWIARLEYLYLDVGSEDVVNTAFVSGSAHFDNRFQIVRAGLNYKFGEPVVAARY